MAAASFHFSPHLHHNPYDYPPPQLSPSYPMPAPPMPSFTEQQSTHDSPPPRQPSDQNQFQNLTDQQSIEGSDRARAYKSRNKRPCDFCRYKKAACHLESAPPCELCIRNGKDCTFVESPAKRRRPNDPNSEKPTNHESMFSRHASRGSFSHTSTFPNGTLPSMDPQNEMLPWENGINPFTINGMTSMGNGMTSSFAFDPSLYQEQMPFETFEPMSASSTTGNTLDHKFAHRQHRQSSSIETTSPQSSSVAANSHLPFETTSGEPSLDRQNSSNAQIVGISGESDPYLLSRYRYDDYNEAVFQSVRVRKMASGRTDQNDDVPTFFMIQHNTLSSKAQPQDRSDTNEKWRRELQELVDDETGKRLMRLFYRYVQPYWPLLSREGGESATTEPRELLPCVLAAIYGHALPFCTWDERLCVEVYTPPSADALFKIAWQACQPLLHTPTIGVLQTLLLLVQRRPTNRHVSDTPFKWVMMGTAVSIAQTLGLNRDPTDWLLPSWEIHQRKRLAWAVYIQDKWLALNFGRSSHICADDWDVSPLADEDFPLSDRRYDEQDTRWEFSSNHFIKLCELTMVVDDSIRELFSIKATRRLHNSLEAMLEVAKPLRIRLTEWYQTLPPGLLPNHPFNGGTSSIGSPSENGRSRSMHQLELDGNGSLQLAYITAKIELFRAMLRPRVTDANVAAVTALRTGALAVAKEISDFLEGLNARELEAFWASYARTNFTIASSFMLLLFVTSPSLSDARESLTLLNAWRSLLRIKSRSCDLLNLALLRLDGVFVQGMDRLIELSPSAEAAWREM